jgi:hypothetical protein
MRIIDIDQRILAIAQEARRKIVGVSAGEPYVVGAATNGIPKPCFPPSSPPNRPDCYRYGCKICDLTKAAGSALAVPANSAFQLTIEPVNTMYFEPIAAEMTVTLAADETENRRVRITAVSVAGSPQEGFDERAPTAATTAFIYSDVLLPSGFGPVPVPWGIFSRANNGKPIIISGFNANADPVNVATCCFGNAYDSLPTDLQTGRELPCGMPWGAGGWGGKGPSVCNCTTGGNGGGGGGGGGGGPMT